MRSVDQNAGTAHTGTAEFDLEAVRFILNLLPLDYRIVFCLLGKTDFHFPRQTLQRRASYQRR